MDLGAFENLLKPFRLEVVEKSVKRALEYRLRASEASRSDGAKSTDDATEWKIIRDSP